MTDEQEIRAGLRALVDQPGPDPSDEVKQDVIRRGRRRLLLRRSAAASGAMVAVAGVLVVGTTVVNGPGGEPSSVSAANELSRGDQATPSAWTRLPDSGCVAGDGQESSSPTDAPTDTHSADAALGPVALQFLQTAQMVVPSPEAITIRYMQRSTEGHRDTVLLDVTDGQRVAGLRLTMRHYAGDPATAAGRLRGCEQVDRFTTPGGDVLQIGTVEVGDGEQLELQVFHPDGQLYTVLTERAEVVKAPTPQVPPTQVTTSTPGSAPATSETPPDTAGTVFDRKQLAELGSLIAQWPPST